MAGVIDRPWEKKITYSLTSLAVGPVARLNILAAAQTPDLLLTMTRRFRCCTVMASFILTLKHKHVGQWPVTKLTTVSKSRHLFIKRWLHKLEFARTCISLSNHLTCPVGCQQSRHLPIAVQEGHTSIYRRVDFYPIFHIYEFTNVLYYSAVNKTIRG
jgi:hypothetical protein